MHLPTSAFSFQHKPLLEPLFFKWLEELVKPILSSRITGKILEHTQLSARTHVNMPGVPMKLFLYAICPINVANCPRKILVIGKKLVRLYICSWACWCIISTMTWSLGELLLATLVEPSSPDLVQAVYGASMRGYCLSSWGWCYKTNSSTFKYIFATSISF